MSWFYTRAGFRGRLIPVVIEEDNRIASTNIEHVGRQYLTAHLLTTVHNASELPD